MDDLPLKEKSIDVEFGPGFSAIKEFYWNLAEE
jgi:hypothetical protein